VIGSSILQVFCGMDTICHDVCLPRPSVFMWFLYIITFIVDNMLAKCQVYSDEFESIGVTV
jgi:hypothetical protein